MTSTSTSNRIFDWFQKLNDRQVSLLLFVGFLLVRLPFRSDFLVNWDAVNFALGVEAFDLGHHQPHAPGYIGYVMLGRGLAALTGDINAALTLLSVLSAAVLPAATYVLARRFLSRRGALLAAVLIGSSPVVWYYGLVSLTYIVAAAVTVPMVWAAVVARRDSSRRHLLLAAGLLVVLGAIRQTDFVLLVPVLAYAAWGFGWADRFRAAAALTVGTLVWLVPLLILAGGPFNYLELSRQLAELAGGRTWAIGMNPVGMLQNVGLVAIGVVAGLNVGLLALPIGWRHRVSGLASLGRDGRRMMALWAGPALFTYLFIHTGQIGYVLMILPILALWVGGVADGVLARRAARSSRVSPSRAVRRVAATFGRVRWAPLATLVALVVLANTAAYVAFPRVSQSVLASEEEDSAGRQVATSLVEDDGVAERMRQYSIDRTDAYWRGAVEFVEKRPADETVVLSVPASGGTYRHLAYYLPDYRVYGVGRDRSGDFGYLFQAYQNRNTYSVEGLDRAEDRLSLPAGVRWIVIPDRDIQQRLPLENRVADRLEVEAGPDVVALRVEPGTVLEFVEDLDGEQHIVLRLPDGTTIDDLPDDLDDGALARQAKWTR